MYTKCKSLFSSLRRLLCLMEIPYFALNAPFVSTTLPHIKLHISLTEATRSKPFLNLIVGSCPNH